MEALGPNPEVMFGSVVEGLKRSIKDDPNLSPAEKVKQMKGLTIDGGAASPCDRYLDRPDLSSGRTQCAKIGSDIRAVQSMAKLGGAIWSSMSDTVTGGLPRSFAARFLQGLRRHSMASCTAGRRASRRKSPIFLGEGFDGLIGHIVSPAAAWMGL
jgi:hypothetical protein